ncbi:MAG: hypothetical protein U0401_10150 [Anaerolineae bacterium]
MRRARHAGRTMPVRAAARAARSFVRRLAAGDRGEETDTSPRQVMNNFFFKPPFRAAPEREESFLSAVLQAKTGDENYPGNLTPRRIGPASRLVPAE